MSASGSALPDGSVRLHNGSSLSITHLTGSRGDMGDASKGRLTTGTGDTCTDIADSTGDTYTDMADGTKDSLLELMYHIALI